MVFANTPLEVRRGLRRRECAKPPCSFAAVGMAGDFMAVAMIYAACVVAIGVAVTVLATRGGGRGAGVPEAFIRT